MFSQQPILRSDIQPALASDDACSAAAKPADGDEQDRLDMARLAAGHEAALNALMNRHAERLFRYLVRSLQNEDDANDLAQETFVRVFRSSDKFDPRQKFSTWLYAIASNLVRSRFRWRTRHAQVSLDAVNETTGDEFGASLPEQKPSPAENLQSAERAEVVRRAVAALPEKWRTPLILAEYEEKSHSEIGAILGCTAKAVEVRIYNARQRLRTSLASLLETM